MPASVLTSRSVSVPAIRSVTPQGVMEMANGIQTARRWDGITAAFEVSGILYSAGAATEAPTSTITNGSFAGAKDGVGTNITTGVYVAAVQFLDDEGQVGDLSPLITISGAGPNAHVDYTNIPVGASRVTQRKIYRSTAGQDDVLYPVITIADNSTTTVNNTDTFTDAQLAALTPLSILNPDGTPNARKYGFPPPHMRVVIQHNDRTHWGVTARMVRGHAEVTNGSANVVMVGSEPSVSMIGWKFMVRGDTAEYTISQWQNGTNTIVLSAVYAGTTNLFASYAIYPPKRERNRIYFSSNGLPEAVYWDQTWADGDTSDAVVPDETVLRGEDLTGMFSYESFVWLTSANNLARWTYTDHPINTGAIYHANARGMVNPRAWCRVENQIALLDREGVWFSNGGMVDPVSAVIQDVFRDEVSWGRQERFFACALPDEETVRFFICLSGSRWPRHSLAFNYRSQQWWAEEYAWEIGDAVNVTIGGRQRMLLLGEHERAWLYGDSPVDGLPAGYKPPGRHTVSSATATSVTVSAPAWNDDADVLDTCVAVVDGRGAGQTYRIVRAAKSTGRLDIKGEWDIEPDTTSKVVIGAVSWLWKSDVLDAVPDAQSPKQVQALAEPTTGDSAFKFRLFYNHKNTPQTADGDVENGLMRVVSGESYITGNLKREQAQGDQEEGEFDGVMWWGHEGGFNPRGSGKTRFVQVEMSGYAETEPVNLHELNIEGAV